MHIPLSRREVLKTALIPCITTLATGIRTASAKPLLRQPPPGVVSGHMTGAAALVETLMLEGTECVYGIPGAQENEIWDTMKTKGLGYLLVTHEASAAFMADGYARSTGKPGVVCIVPGPGVTNCLTGIGEALLDSIPLVCIVGDVACGEKYRPFQVHSLPQAALLQPVTKMVIQVRSACEIPGAVRQAFQLSQCGEPGPVAVIIPYNLLIDSAHYDCPPLAPSGQPFDDNAVEQAIALLGNHRPRVGIYAGLGCMDYSCLLVQVAEMLQAPVATSVSGKGAFPENHPLAVGWGYGPQGTKTAEEIFKSADIVLAIGVRFSEVSTGFYSLPERAALIHVDANRCNLAQIMKTDVCVHADAGLFLQALLARADCLRRPVDTNLQQKIQHLKSDECRGNAKAYPCCGVDPMAFLLFLRQATSPDALLFVDVTLAEHWAAQVFTTCQPRTYFNPTDNQAMGWSIAAAIGAQRVFPGRQTVTVTGDGCLMMSAVELSTAARECLPVKFFVLDDQAYGFMQAVQKPQYHRTTATVLARLDYAALAQAMGVVYQQIVANCELDAGIASALQTPGPVLIEVKIDYGKRPIRWIQAVRKRYTKELKLDQKVRVAARLGIRSLQLAPQND
jgi:acetolactate synthase-1/2/3 large subunit